MSWWWRQCVFKVFPRCPLVNINPRTVYNHMDAGSFLLVTDAVFQAEMWQIVGRTGGRTGASPLISAVFFSSYKLPKTVTVNTLLLFGPVMLLCGKFLFIKLSYQSVRPTHPRSAPPAYPFTLVRFTNNTALLLPQEADQRRREVSPLAVSETFTQRRRRRIGGSQDPHMQTAVWMELGIGKRSACD